MRVACVTRFYHCDHKFAVLRYPCRQLTTDHRPRTKLIGARGTLSKAQLGFSMPPYAPLFPKPPYFYKNAALLVFKYVTNDFAARMVPDAVELSDPPTAGLVFASYPSSNLGPYDEVVLYLDVTFKGRPFQFGAFLYVTTDSAMAAGREMGGYPKKIARIEFLAGPAQTAVMERPSGLRICTGTMRPKSGSSQTPTRNEWPDLRFPWCSII